jgi:hypothetical protein
MRSIQNSNYASQALAYIIKQNATIICELGRVSNDICGILNQAAEQTRLQHHIAHAAAHVRALLDSVYSAEALNLRRLSAMRERIEECCPKEPPPPACQQEPCAEPGPAPQPPDIQISSPMKGDAKSTAAHKHK